MYDYIQKLDHIDREEAEKKHVQTYSERRSKKVVVESKSETTNCTILCSNVVVVASVMEQKLAAVN
jgi:hypothetical protein